LFEHAASDRWPEHLQCRFEKLSFIDGTHNKIKFTLTDQQKRDTKAVSFRHCSAVDFIDLGILKRFPKLNGLRISESNIPILKKIFTFELKMIQHLGLSWNKIQVLEPHVFDELVELKWIDLLGNDIEKILGPIFAKNKKLEFVDLSFNRIQSLYPNLFDGLPKLAKVCLFENPTIDESYQSIEMLKMGLKPLFANYWLTYGSKIVEQLQLVS
jgi:Leucine-rich repeat (LRR) protein